jgi:signal transduction histidine kinase
MPETPVPVVLGDITRIREVLERLLANAFRFTDQGTITLQVSMTELTDQQVIVCFTVEDTGIGIPADMKQKIFDALTQVDESITRRYGGAGLGLTLCKRLVERMGGTIGVEDNPKGGSRFWFELELPVYNP